MTAVRRDLRDRRNVLPPRVARALALAGISPSKLGAARHASLSETERKLYFWIVRRFATEGRPKRSDTDEIAGRLELDTERVLETLAHHDLVHLDGNGAIAVAYPFSGRPTAHRVRFPNGHEAFAMCAIDALGIAPMFGEPIEIRSADPLTAEEIHARVAPSGAVESRPDSAVVVGGAHDHEGDSCASCCPVLNFFASAQNARQWLDEQPDVRGEVISIADASLAGRAVFGAVLEQA